VLQFYSILALTLLILIKFSWKLLQLKIAGICPTEMYTELYYAITVQKKDNFIKMSTILYIIVSILRRENNLQFWNCLDG